MLAKIYDKLFFSCRNTQYSNKKQILWLTSLWGLILLCKRWTVWKSPFKESYFFIQNLIFLMLTESTCDMLSPTKMIWGWKASRKSSPIPWSLYTYILLWTPMATVTTQIFRQICYKVFILYTRLVKARQVWQICLSKKKIYAVTPSFFSLNKWGTLKY